MVLPVRSYVQEADIAWTRNGHLVYTTSDGHTSKTRNRFQWRQRHQSLRDTGGNEMDNARSYLVRSSLSSGFCICLSELPAENMEIEEKE
jgi:hypothetical protein